MAPEIGNIDFYDGGGLIFSVNRSHHHQNLHKTSRREAVLSIVECKSHQKNVPDSTVTLPRPIDAEKGSKSWRIKKGTQVTARDLKEKHAKKTGEKKDTQVTARNLKNQLSSSSSAKKIKTMIDKNET